MIAEQYRIFGMPMATRAARRRLVIGYWVSIALLCTLFVHYQTRHGVENLNPWNLFPLLVGLVSVLGGVKAGGAVKQFSGRDSIPVSSMSNDEGELSLFQRTGFERPDSDSALDEREQNERNAVHFIAYTIARWFTLGLFFVYAIAGAIQVGWFLRIGPLFLFLLTLTLWSLPQSLILWNEPDMEEAQ